MTSRILFARIGHMIYYAGPQPGDEKPVGGGSYNKESLGHEARNFQFVDGQLYGYCQPYLRWRKGKPLPANISLERIDPSCVGNKLDNVLVIFFATKPKEGGQVIVGWYNGATVNRHKIEPSGTLAKARQKFGYYMTCPAKNAVLLPTWKRPTLFRGKKKGKPGQANAFYLFDKGEHRDLSLPSNKWIAEAIQFVNEYSAESLLLEPMAEMMPAVEEILEAALNRGTGQGYNISPHARKAIEMRAMTVAEAHFAKLYKVDATVHKTKPYDLLCKDKSSGKIRLFVEVKGTQNLGTSIILTKNEVASARKAKTALFVLYSVKLSGKGKKVIAKGGVARIRSPWAIDDKRLKALTYSYSLEG